MILDARDECVDAAVLDLAGWCDALVAQDALELHARSCAGCAACLVVFIGTGLNATSTQHEGSEVQNSAYGFQGTPLSMDTAAHPEADFHARYIPSHVVKSDTANQAAVMPERQEGEALPCIERLGGLTAKALGGCHGRLVQGPGQGGWPSAQRAQAFGDRLTDSHSVAWCGTAQKQAGRVERSWDVRSDHGRASCLVSGERML